jgi:N-methylhydantoinase A
LCADLEAVRSAAFLKPLDVASVAETSRYCLALEDQALAELGLSDGVNVRWRAELRYAGQGFELSVELPRDAQREGSAMSGDPEAQGATMCDIRTRFEQEYRRTYGHELIGHRIDFVALRVIATVPPRGPRTLLRVRKAPFRAPTAPWRKAYFGREHGLVETPVIERWELSATPRPGPLIIEEYEGTTVVPPQASAMRDPLDNIIITLAEERSGAT